MSSLSVATYHVVCAFLLFVLVSGFLNFLWIRYSHPPTESLNEIFYLDVNFHKSVLSS
jgi:hypothetical protein